MAASVNHLQCSRPKPAPVRSREDRLRHDLEPCLLRIVQYALAQAAPFPPAPRVRALAQEIGGRRSSPEASSACWSASCASGPGPLTSGDTESRTHGTFYRLG